MAYEDHIYDQTNPTGNTYSKRISMKRASLFSLHIEYGALTGTITLWQSNKADPDPDSDTDWIQNTDVTFDALSGSGSSQFINAGNAAARYYKVKYAHTSGTGDLDIWIHVCEA